MIETTSFALTRYMDGFMDQPTAIYVMAAGALAKIGISNHPGRRTRQLQTSNGGVVRLIWHRWMDGADAKQLEREIHKQHRGTNIHAHGEWYYLNTAGAIDIISRKIRQLGLYSVWEGYSKEIERECKGVRA